MLIDIPKGMSIYNAVAYAKTEAAKTRYGIVDIEFNGIKLAVNEDSLDLDISTIYQLECVIQRLKSGK